ncbi:Uncharacterised protein [Acinetobacter baumannii]|nr:Uncharacterised protein [Acinetobacter baumannii]
MPLPNFIALRKFLGTNYDELHATLLVKGFIRDIDQSSGVLDQILFRGKFTCSEVLSSHRFPVKVQYLAIAAAVEEMEAKGMQLPKHGIASKCTTCSKCKNERALLETYQ